MPAYELLKITRNSRKAERKVICDELERFEKSHAMKKVSIVRIGQSF